MVRQLRATLPEGSLPEGLLPEDMKNRPTHKRWAVFLMPHPPNETNLI
jgi:hypothetical protein